MSVESLHRQLVERAEDRVENALDPQGCAAAVGNVLREHRLEVVPDAGVYAPDGQRHCVACGWLEQCGPCPTLAAIADGLQIKFEGREKW